MTTIALHTVNCDTTGEDKDPQCEWWIGNERTAAQARKMAKKAGWAMTPSGKGPDFCPACRDANTPGKD